MSLLDRNLTAAQIRTINFLDTAGKTDAECLALWAKCRAAVANRKPEPEPATALIGSRRVRVYRDD